MRSWRKISWVWLVVAAGAIAALVVGLLPAARNAEATAARIFTVAGGGDIPGPVPATSITVRPAAVAANSVGDFFVADTWHDVVRKVAPSGEETVVAGNGMAGSSGDRGPATGAELDGPVGVAVDSTGDLFIAEGLTNRVRMVAAKSCHSSCPYGLRSTVAGDIYGVAGNGTYGYSGDRRSATAAALGIYNVRKPLEAGQPGGVAVGLGGDLLIADANNDRVRLVAANDCSSTCPYGLRSTVAGDIYTVAGNGTQGHSGEGGPAASAELNHPTGIAVDPTGDLVIADASSARVRLVAARSCSAACPYGLSSTVAGDIYTVAGNGTQSDSGDGGPAISAGLSNPASVAIGPSGDLLIADMGVSNLVRLVAARSCSSACPYGLGATIVGDIYTVAGNGTQSSSGGGRPAVSASLGTDQGLIGVAVDPVGDLLVADGGSRVRLVAATSCSAACPFGIGSTVAGDIYTVAGNGKWGYAGAGGAATAASLYFPIAVAVNSSGDLFVVNEVDNLVAVIAAKTCPAACPFGLSSTVAGDIYTVAGTGTWSGGYSGDGGIATTAELDGPAGIAVDASGDLLIADTGNDRIRLVAARSCSAACPFGLTSTVAGDIYTVAGNGSRGYSGDHGPAVSAKLHFPSRIAVDAKWGLFIADAGNNSIRFVAARNCPAACPFGLSSTVAGDIYTVAGNGTKGFSGNGGLATSAELDDPQGLAVDASGDLLVSDGGNDRVRLVGARSCSAACPYGLRSVAAGNIYTVAGSGRVGFSGDGGPATSAELFHPADVSVDAAGGPLHRRRRQ
ncbi:MAG: hypothetical protein M0020_02710 [Actinomycetota bacterium]|nr:hypothetical protein [Actinomycetota bacterium]